MPPVGTMDFGTSPSDVTSPNLDVLLKASKQTPQETAEVNAQQRRLQRHQDPPTLSTRSCSFAYGRKETPKGTLSVQEKRASAWGRDGCHGEYLPTTHVVLTSHPRRGCPIKIKWGAKTPEERGALSLRVIRCSVQRVDGPAVGAGEDGEDERRDRKMTPFHIFNRMRSPPRLVEADGL